MLQHNSTARSVCYNITAQLGQCQHVTAQLGQCQHITAQLGQCQHNSTARSVSTYNTTATSVNYNTQQHRYVSIPQHITAQLGQCPKTTLLLGQCSTTQQNSWVSAARLVFHYTTEQLGQCTTHNSTGISAYHNVKQYS